MNVSASERVIADEQTRHWRKRKLKFVFSVRTSNVDKHIVEGETAVRLCNYTDVYYHDKITSDMPLMQGSATESQIERFGLKKGQVLLTKDSESWEDIAVPAYVTETMPEVVCGYHLAAIEPYSDEVDGRFLSWLAKSPVLNDQFKLSAKGVTRFGLSQYALKNAVIDVPPLEYQLKVAAFLDRKTAEIDTLIAKQRRLLDRLAEKRTALITRAVTKGLNPDAPMKDSGIEWLGEIPAHWSIPLLRHVAEVRGGVTKGRKLAAQKIVELPYLRVANVQDGFLDLCEVKSIEILASEVEHYSLHVGDVLMNEGGDNDKLGRGGVWHGEIEPCLHQNHVFAVRPRVSNLSDWLALLTQSTYGKHYFWTTAKQSTNLASISSSNIKRFPVVLPPGLERTEIVEHVNAKLGSSSALVDTVILAIEKLEEYRSALITNAVTGQIKVA